MCNIEIIYRCLHKIVNHCNIPLECSVPATFIMKLVTFPDSLFICRYEINDIVRFTLTVRKNYRNVPYHNWTHAFSVAHAMFTVLKVAKHEFSPFEVGRQAVVT